MLLPKIFIVVDRGEAKLFHLAHHGGRPAVFQLEDAVVLTEAHQRYSERFTDQAGSFPNSGSQGHSHSVAERQTLDLESDRRLVARIAEKISLWLEEKGSPAWALAAPAEANSALLAHLPAAQRKNLRRNVRRDLIHASPDSLMAQLEAASSSDIV